MPLRLSSEDIKQLGLKGIRVKAGQSKYRAVRTEYNGVSYASKAESKRAIYHDIEASKANVPGLPPRYWWIAQPKFRLGCPENVYVPDYLVCSSPAFTDDFEIHVEDVKGHETAKFKRDKKLWAKYGPCPLWLIRGGKVIEVIEGGRQ